MMEEICEKIRDIQGKYYYGNGKRKRGWKEQLKADYKKNIKEFFITHDTLIGFDFTNDCFNEEYMEENCPVYKYILYRVSKYKSPILYREAEKFRKINKNKYTTVDDPDSGSLLLQVLYEDLYDVQKFRDSSLFIKEDKGKADVDKKDENVDIMGDTMNSVQSSLNSYIEQCLEKENANFKDIRKKSKEKYYPVSFTYFLELFLRYKKKILEGLEEVNASELMETYHTLGNFIVIPTGCNGPRGVCILKDYWDLTLACIYNWYSQKENREDRIVKVIDNKCLEYNIGMIFAEESSLKKYVKWLNLFGTWDKFVEDNYLGDVKDENKIIENFVEKKNDEHYGRPRELWPGHFTAEVTPTDSEEYRKFFSNSSKYIKNRGFIMHQKLKKINSL